MQGDELRVFIWVEDKAQKSVFTDAIQKQRGRAKVVTLRRPIDISQLEEAYGETGEGAHGKSGLKVCLLPEGHPISHDNLDQIREDDKLLLRGGKRLAEKTAEKTMGARRVDIEYKVTALADVNTVQQNFFCDFLLVCNWYEPTLKGVPHGQVDWELCFDPMIDIRNAFELELCSQPFGAPQSTRLDEATGMVTYILRFKGVLSEPMVWSPFGTGR